jgi:pimeloyl-ACP methyl ester carboxylesterase
MDAEPNSIEKPPRVIRKIKYGTDKFVLVKDTRIHYIEAGKGETIILLPGSESTFRVWNRLMPVLAEHYRVLALDSFGDRKKSDPSPSKGIGEKTDLVAGMVQQMSLEKVTLIGISLAGAIAFDFASRFPGLTDKLVSIGGYIAESQEKKGVIKTYIRRIGANRRPSINLEEEAKSITAPLMYIYGTKTDYKEISLKQNLEFLQMYLPHAWIVAMEGGIFEIAMQEPEELSNLILEFLGKK